MLPDLSLTDSRPQACHRSTENRVRPQDRLVRRPIQFDQRHVNCSLIGDIHSFESRPNRAVHIGEGSLDTLAGPARAAIAQLDRLMPTGACPRGNSGPPE